MIQEKDPNTEQHILEVAERLFLDKGFALTTTTEIAKEAGYNQSLIHYYFRTKENLFQTIFKKKASLFLSAFLQSNEENIPFEEKLKKIIEIHFDAIKDNPKVPFLFINELTTNPKRLKTLASETGLPNVILTQLNKELQTEIKKGNIRQINLIDLLMTIVSLNTMLFLATPAIKSILKLSKKEYDKMVEERKKENVLIILRSLKP